MLYSPYAKHAEHDQSTHGNWSHGSKVFPYEDASGTFHYVATDRSKPKRGREKTLCGLDTSNMRSAAPFAVGDPRGAVHLERGHDECVDILANVEFDKHMGPGPHPSGSSQKVHGRGTGTLEYDEPPYPLDNHLKDPDRMRAYGDERVTRLKRWIERQDFPNKNVWIRVDSSEVVDILKEERLLSLRETGFSNGSTDISLRDYWESKAFEIDPYEQPSIIYGYVDEEDGYLQEGPSVDQYGDVALRLKDGVRGRTTWTYHDSLGSKTRPTSMVNPDLGSIEDPYLQPPVDPARRTAGVQWADIGERAFYTEAQIHGGVTLDDIAEIYVPDNIFDFDYENAWEEFTSRGIQFTTYEGRWSPYTEIQGPVTP